MTQQINLIDPALRVQRQWCNGRDLVLAAALLAGAVLAHHQWESHQLAQAVSASAALDAAGGAAPAGTDQAQLQARQGQVLRDEALLRTLGQLDELPRDTVPRLRALLAALPDDMWLQDVQFSGRHGMRIAGGALSAAALAAYSRRLGEEAIFKGLPLPVVMVEPRSAAAAAERPDTGAATAPARPGVPAHYGFVLSTTATEPAAQGAAPKEAP